VLGVETMWHIEVLGGDDVARRGDDVAHRGVRWRRCGTERC